MAVSETDTVAESPADRRNARLYLTGLGCSVIGSMALSLVAGIWVKSLTGSSSEAGLVSACIYLPSLFGPLAGIVANRVARRRLLVRLSVVSAVADLPLLGYGTVKWYCSTKEHLPGQGAGQHRFVRGQSELKAAMSANHHAQWSTNGLPVPMTLLSRYIFVTTA